MSVLARAGHHTHELIWNPEQGFIAELDTTEHPYDDLDSLLSGIDENLVLASNIQDEWYALTEDEVGSIADSRPLLGLDTWDF